MSTHCPVDWTMIGEYFVSSFVSVPCLVSFFLLSSPLCVLPFALPSSNRDGGRTWINNIESLESWTPQSANIGEVTVRPILLSNNISYGSESLRVGCGFFCYSIPCHTGYSFAVFFVIYQTDYTDPDDLEVVWTANRERLVKENATLGLTSTGNLVLKDADGSLVWSTHKFAQDFQGIMIQETGNLVLLNSSNGTMWQSFDHPTDTLLRGQKLKVGQKLIANISPTNTSQGIVYATMLVSGFALYTAPAPPQFYFKYPRIPTTLNLAYTQFGNETFSYYPEGFPSNPIAFSSTMLINSLYFKIASNGHELFYSFEQKTGVSLHDYLSTFTSALGTCDYPTTCGNYGICTDGQCSCSKEANVFGQIDASKPNLGCLPCSPLVCPEKPTMSGTKSYQFLELDHVSYFSYDWGIASVPGLVSREECKDLCLTNCSCKAAFFRSDVFENYSSGYCYLESNVYSIKMNTPSDTFYNSTAYIKVQRSSEHAKRLVIGISVSVASGMIAFFLVLLVWITRFRKGEQKQKRDEIDNDDEDDSLNLRTRLPLRFSFQELQNATNDFSLKLGGGGFGSVYGGVLGKRSRELSDDPLLLVLRNKDEMGRLSDLINPRLDDQGMDAKEPAVTMLKVGMLCIQDDLTRRPSMSTVVKALEEMTELYSPPTTSSTSPHNPFPSTTRSDRLELSYTSLSSALSGR
ncbi:hypothetical protein SUGI_0718320 [Cryptomeria japonica]|nr:hypothetical protein SUGI_0718320 [Cryptomeria japonica]